MLEFFYTEISRRITKELSGTPLTDDICPRATEALVYTVVLSSFAKPGITSIYRAHGPCNLMRPGLPSRVFLLIPSVKSANYPRSDPFRS
jgi:hypothetical protein